MILGLEVRDGTVMAVTADEGGNVVARTVQNGTGAAAAADAVRAVGGAGSAGLGVAVRDAREDSIGHRQRDDVPCAARGA